MKTENVKTENKNDIVSGSAISQARFRVSAVCGFICLIFIHSTAAISSDSIILASQTIQMDGTQPEICFGKGKDGQTVTVICQPSKSAVETPELTNVEKKQESKGKTSRKTDSSDSKLKVNMKGYRYFKFRTHVVNGDKNQYMYREGLISHSHHLEQGTDLNLDVNIADKTKLKASFYQLPQQVNKTTLSLSHQPYNVTYGDFDAGFDNGSISPFSKSINGVQFLFDKDQYKFKFITSQSKSETTTHVFSGRNLKGPYDLGASYLVENSIVVKINGMVVPKTDYQIDLYIGDITFNYIILPHDLVSVTFEQQILGGLNEGAISGYSFDYKQNNKKWSIGSSHIIKNANKATKSAVQTVLNEPPTIGADGVTLTVNNRFLVYSDPANSNGSETIFKNGFPLKPKIDYNRVDTLGSPLIAAGTIASRYSAGLFILNSPLAASDSVMISYSYYDMSFIHPISNSQVRMDPPDNPLYGYLSYDTADGSLYYGSEDIRFCTDINIVPSSCIYKLNRGKDYAYDMESKRITNFSQTVLADLHADANSGLFILDAVSYPDVSSSDSKYNQTLDTYRISFTPSKSADFHLETAKSYSDVSSVPITETNHIVRFATSTPLDCSIALADPKSCVFSIGNSNIVSASLDLYFNSILDRQSLLIPLKDYIPDNVNGTVQMLILIPSNSVLRANYQYHVKDRGLVSAQVTNMDSSLSIKKTNTKLQFGLWKGDPLFSPIGGAGNRDKNRTAINVSQAIFNMISVSADILNFDTAEDIDSIHTIQSRDSNYSLSFNKTALKKFSYAFGSHSQSDNRVAHNTDSAEKYNSLTYISNMPFLKNAKMSFTYAGEKIDDNTVQGANIKSTAKEANFDYKPSKKLAVNSKFVVSAVGSTSVIESFTSTNTSTALKIFWQPGRIVTVTGDIDRQKMSDTRPGDALNSVDSSRVNLTTKSFGRLNPISFSLFKEDRPSANGVSYGISSNSLTTGYRISNSILFSPTFNHSGSVISNISRTTNNAAIYSVDYRPSGKKYHISINRDSEKGKMTDSLQNRDTIQNNSGISAIAGYDPSKKQSYVLRWKSDNSSSAGTPSTNVTYDLTINRLPKKDSKQWLMFSTRIASYLNVSNTDTNLEIGDETRLSKLFSINFRYKLSVFNNSLNPDSNFSGNLFETTIRAEF